MGPVFALDAAFYLVAHVYHLAIVATRPGLGIVVW